MTEDPMIDMSEPMSAIVAEPQPAAILEEFVEHEDPAAPEPAAGKSGIDDLQAVFDVPVKVQAVLGRARMPIGELLKLTAGMVVELDRKVGEPVDIFVNDRLIARGEVVLIDYSLGITLTEIVQQVR